ncbi:GSU2403 family nucleotidyltransferase fold protein [Treponema sp.]|uniref:GSU2403 family nucleotidyltransferase fold protein n=1 Tax=Treponema sp. TaxID=166 RepID=UPI003F02709B
MTKEQEITFWQTIKTFKEIGLLQHVMIIGSWAEYLYPFLFETDFIPNLKTRDIDFFYRNINLPKEKIPVIEKLKEIGYVYDENDGISRFYKEDFLELEFLTRILGAGTEGHIKIKSLGIISEGLRVLNILASFPREVEVTSPEGLQFCITVPEPAVYAVQKILTNPNRNPPEKKTKDIAAVKEILYHIEKSQEHLSKLQEVYNSLSKNSLQL